LSGPRVFFSLVLDETTDTTFDSDLATGAFCTAQASISWSFAPIDVENSLEYEEQNHIIPLLRRTD
jgi:hypothetical protein